MLTSWTKLPYPESMEEKIVPPHLYAQPKPEALCFRRNGKVFQNGQIWSFCSGNVNLPLYYCRVQKITLIQASEQEPEFKLQVCRLKAMPFPEEVIQWEDKKMPVGSGTFWVYKSLSVFSPDDVLHRISMDGNEYTILPKIGELWAIYRTWDPQMTFSELENKYMDFDVVEVLGDALEYKVLALEAALLSHEDVKKKNFFFRGAERKPFQDGSEVIFTKVFQTGQIWSYCSGLNYFPLYYGRIQKITAIQVLDMETKYKLHVRRFMPTRSPDDVILWEDKKMSVGCGAFYARNALEIVTPDDLSQQIMPQTSTGGNEFTILPKVGEVLVIYRFWNQYMDSEGVGRCSYDIVEILDDTLGYKVLLLEAWEVEDGYMFFKAVTKYKYNEIAGSEPIFTIPKSERHKAPAPLVTKEMYGVLEDLIQVDTGALPFNLWPSDLF